MQENSDTASISIDDITSIHTKRQKIRTELKLYTTPSHDKKPKYYILDMFPYASGAGLHVGHPKGYIATDVLSRKKRMEGFNVLHPMGFDSFGLPTEQFAIKQQRNPKEITKECIAMFKNQLQSIGFDYDRDREISTTDPEFYKWTQRIFIQMYEHYYDHTLQKARPIQELIDQIKAKPEQFDCNSPEQIDAYVDNHRLAFISYEPVNRCPSCKTGLANEDLEDGKCERCGSAIERKPMRQWMIRITEYAQRLLDGLDTLDQRPDHVKDMQRNRIGKSTGTDIDRLIPNKQFDPLQYSPSNDGIEHFVRGIIRNTAGEILMCQPIKRTSAKMMIGGKIQDTETIEQCLRREVSEEIGCTIDTMSYRTSIPLIASKGRHIGHFVDITIQGEIKNCEPDKIVSHHWVKYYPSDNILGYTVSDNGTMIDDLHTLGGRMYYEIKALVSHGGVQLSDPSTSLMQIAIPRTIDKQKTYAYIIHRHCIKLIQFETLDTIKEPYQCIRLYTINEHTRLQSMIDTLYNTGQINNMSNFTRDLQQQQSRPNVLIASHNQAKISRYKEFLSHGWIHLVSLNDISIHVDEIEENAADELLIAKQKAQGFFEKTCIPSLGMDTGLYFSGLADHEQPKKHTKRIAGVLDTDDQETVRTKMTQYYTNLAKKHGGEIQGYFLDAYVLYDGHSYHTATAKRHIILTDTVHPTKDIYFPLCALYKTLQHNTSYYDLTQQQLEEFLHESNNVARKLLSTYALQKGVTCTTYTTRIDTIYGVEAIVLAPEHQLVEKITQASYKNNIQSYQQQALAKTDLQRTDLAKDKSGVFTGSYAIHPITGKNIPIWIADYVLVNYGTGAVMAVPGHDERDFAFAQKYNIPVSYVVGPKFGEQKPSAQAKNSGYAFIYDTQQKKFLIRNILGDRSIPGGTIEQGESLLQGTIREVIEETGYYNFTFQDYIGCMQMNYFAGGHKNTERENNAHSILFNLVNHDTIKKNLDPGEQDAEIIRKSMEEIEEHFATCGPEQFLAEESKYMRQSLKNYMEHTTEIYTDYGYIANSGLFSGQSSQEASINMQNRLEDRGIGKKKTQYKLQDWVFSRQRYRGEPIPMIYEVLDSSTNTISPKAIPLDISMLPLELPDVENYEPTGTVEGPLADIDAWIHVTIDGKEYVRESNTMPQRAGSSRYRLRYMDAKNNQNLVDKDIEAYRGQVDVYVGGLEHATRHLIYGRFWHKFLYDIGIVTHDEPFKKLRSQGLIMAEDGRKMSKRRGNVINPDDVIAQVGADAFRLYEMFMGPFENSVNRSTAGVKGMSGFIEKILKLAKKVSPSHTDDDELLHQLHVTIKKLTEDIDNFKYNTAISQMMIFVNHTASLTYISQDSFEKFIQILAPFAPHLADEIRSQLGYNDSISTTNWPIYDSKYTFATQIDMAIQINGKVRDTITIAPDTDQATVLSLAKSRPKVQKYLENMIIIKEIYIPGKICNIVVK